MIRRHASARSEPGHDVTSAAPGRPSCVRYGHQDRRAVIGVGSFRAMTAALVSIVGQQFAEKGGADCQP